MKRYSTSLLILCLSMTLQAQNKNLNPTVQVTNAYQASLVEADKPAAIVTIPDSLYKFNLDFDYSGFENPYLGTADFNPFLTDLDIAPRRVVCKKLYLKAGAGYTFSPQLDLSWGIKSKGNFKIGAFAGHDSYFGKYGGYMEKGSDARSRAGLDFRFDADKVNSVLSLSYDGVMGKNSDRGLIYHYNSACAKMALNSNLNPEVSALRYRLLANYYYGFDRFEGVGTTEHVVDADGFIDLVLGKHLVSLDVDFDMANSGDYSGISAIARPRYIFTTGALSLTAGVAVGWCNTAGTAVKDRNMDFFPSIDLYVKAVPHKLIFYAVADLESSLFTLRDAALRTRFYVPDEQRAITKTQYVNIGLKGDLSGKFSYDAKAGYVREVNPALFSFGDQWLSFVHVPDLEHYLASLKLKAAAGPFRIGGQVEYRQYKNADKLDIVPPAFKANAYLGLDIHKRWNLEISALYQSYYKSNGYYADDFVDLNAEIRYNFTSRFGVYLKGTNILGQQLHMVHGYARSGVCVLGGIVLNL